jgi:hypothetical protein
VPGFEQAAAGKTSDRLAHHSAADAIFEHQFAFWRQESAIGQFARRNAGLDLLYDGIGGPRCGW